MNDIPVFVTAVGGGFVLGTFFFTGLRWTAHRLLVSPHPAVFLLASFLVRTAVVVAGLWFFTQGRWTHLVAALAGFLAARVVVVRWSKSCI